MKKYIFICILALTTVSMTSCLNINKSDSDKEPSLQKITKGLVVNQNQWNFDTNLNVFYCHFDVPDITWDVYHYAEVSVNREYNSDTENAYQVALPETSYKVEYGTDENGNETGEIFYYAQHVDYIYGKGFVEVYYTISDYFYPTDFKPEAMRFRLQITY